MRTETQRGRKKGRTETIRKAIEEVQYLTNRNFKKRTGKSVLELLKK